MKPFILGIAGGTASGKSTLARSLVEKLGDQVSHITHDSYYKTIPRAVANHPDRVKLHNYDHPDALDTDLMVTDLALLHLGSSITTPRWDFSTSISTAAAVLVKPRLVILVEGILIFAHKDLFNLFDATVFVDTPDDIRLGRRFVRDIEERGQKPREVFDQYMSTVRPMHNQYVAPGHHRADLVVSGEDPVEDLVSSVLELISSGVTLR